MAPRRKQKHEWESPKWTGLFTRLDLTLTQARSQAESDAAMEALLAQELASWPADEVKRLLAVIEFKQAMFRRAVELLPRVWTNFEKLRARFNWNFENPSRGVFAGLYTCRKQDAIGASVLRMCERYTLVVSPELMGHAPEAQDKVLLHELCHMGYSGHGAKFREHCTRVGGVVSGTAVSGEVEPGVYAEWKPPGAARYARHPQRFESQAEATAFVVQEMAARRSGGLEPGRWRLAFI